MYAFTIAACVAGLGGPVPPTSTHTSFQIAPEAQAAEGAVSAAELEAFLEPFMREQMKELHAPAAVLSFVQNGRLVFSKGWGVTDLDSPQPIHPDQTVFRMASISKVFTTTAIMQLVERGLVDLEADVNDYLTYIEIREAFNQPVRIWHLMTHTAGFEDRVVGIAARHSEDRSLRRYLKENQPYRVMPPGEQISYSNYSTNVLGLVVEEVTGQSFESYVRDNILLPLGMYHSSFARRPDLVASLPTGYLREGDAVTKVPDFTINMVASSTLIGTAHDMARFMAAHLHEGALPPGYDAEPVATSRILRADTARRMHQTTFTQHPLLAGNAHGFWERHMQGLRLLEHAGEWFGYHCVMVLIPDLQTGFFLAHTGGDVRLRTRLTKALVSRFLPRSSLQAPALTSVGREVAPARNYAGNYLWNRYVRRSFAKIVSLMDYWIIRLDANDDGSLTIHYPGHLVPPERFIPVDKDLFQREDGDGYLAFRSHGGGATHLYAHIYDLPIVAERVGILSLPAFQLHTGVGAAAITLSGLLLLPMGALWRRRRGERLWVGWHDRLALGVTATFLVFFAGMVVVLGPPTFIEPAYGVPAGLQELVYMPVVGLGFTLLLLAGLVWAWMRGHGTWLGRVYLTLMALSALWLVYFLYEFNMVPGGVS